MTRVDLVQLTIAVLCIAVGFFLARAIVKDPIDPPALGLVALTMPVYATIALTIFLKGWQVRALHRIRWVGKHLGTDEPKPIARMVLMGYWTGMFGSVVVVVSALFATIAGAWLYANGVWSRDFALYVGFAFVLLATLPLAPVTRRSNLAMEIGLNLSNSRPRQFWVEPTAKFKAERKKSMPSL